MVADKKPKLLSSMKGYGECLVQQEWFDISLSFKVANIK